jgi:hypothetical protein
MTSEAQPLGPELSPPPVSRTPSSVTAGSLVARTFSTWWRRIWTLAGLTLVMMVPVFALGVGILLAADGSPHMASVVVPIGFMVLVWLALLVQTSGHTHGATQHLSGRPVGVGAMLRTGFRRLPAVLGLVLLASLAYLGFALVLVVVGAVVGAVFAYAGGSRFVTGALAMISVPFLLVLGAGFSLTIPVIVAERAGPITGLRRSWHLTRGRRGAIFAALLVVALVLAGVTAAHAGLVATVLGPGGLPDTGPPISSGLMLLMVVGWILFAPLLPVATAVAYHDLRLEKEGAADLAQVFR